VLCLKIFVNESPLVLPTFPSDERGIVRVAPR
jgi:hypothetical protein